MAALTYKCPNCGAYLKFDPETQKWKCDFCGSTASQSELENDNAENEKHEQSTQVVYRCSNCGSEIVTDETTVATYCYYCHSPVVLEGKLTDELTPDLVLPFSISKEQAVSKFMDWAKTKKYAPDAFFQETKVRGMNGVYYPHFVCECDVDTAFQGEAQKIRTVTDPQYITTYTDHFRVSRDTSSGFKNMIRPALSKTNKKLSDAIHPFPLDKCKAFSATFLSGFLAERRDVEIDSVRSGIEQEAAGYAETMTRGTVAGYNGSSGSCTSRAKRFSSKYVLLPTWVLTYPNSKDPSQPYYYAMNGCTGEVCGKLPVDKKKLARHSVLVALGVLAAALLISYFLI